MAFELERAVSATRYRVQDPSKTGLNAAAQAAIDAPDLTSAIRAAISDFSRDFPNELIAEFPGDDSAYFEILTVLPKWRERWSNVGWIEYPSRPITDNTFPTLLESGTDWQVVDRYVSAVKTQYLYLPNYTPATTENLRVGYTGFHTLKGLDGETDTSIWLAYEEPFYDLCAYKALQTIASKFAQMGSPSTSADVVNYPDVSRRINAQADVFLASYRRGVGLDDAGGNPASAGGWLEWDTANSYGGDQLFHSRRFR